jgi:branched-chain amino acid transport system ATP-binding protein
VTAIPKADDLRSRAGAAPLELRGVHAGYGRTAVLRDIDLVVPEGEVVALLGPNGAGKTTLLRTASGLLRPSKGNVIVDGKPQRRTNSARLARAGVCLIPEGRGIFRQLTVRENLRLHVPPWADPEATRSATERAVAAFPRLGERLSQYAGTLSGGEQQMLALARAFISSPRIVLLDEVSMGLAPRIIDQIFEALRTLAATGVSLLLVEQYVDRALQMADRVVLMERGRISFTGLPSEVDEERLLQHYFGLPSGGASVPSDEVVVLNSPAPDQNSTR